MEQGFRAGLARRRGRLEGGLRRVPKALRPQIPFIGRNDHTGIVQTNRKIVEATETTRCAEPYSCRSARTSQVHISNISGLA